METIITNANASTTDVQAKAVEAATLALVSYGAISLAGDLAAKVGKEARTKADLLKEACATLGIKLNGWKPEVVSDPALKAAQTELKTLSDQLMAAMTSDSDDAMDVIVALRPKVKAAKLHVEEYAKNESSKSTLDNLSLRCTNSGGDKRGSYAYGSSMLRRKTEDVLSETVRAVEKAARSGSVIAAYAPGFAGEALAASLENRELLDTLTEEDLTPRMFEVSDKTLKTLKEKVIECRAANDAAGLETAQKELSAAQEAHKPVKVAFDKYAAKKARTDANAAYYAAKDAKQAADAELADADSTDLETVKLLSETAAKAAAVYAKATDAAKKLGLTVDAAA